jgi:hypothetical protein
VASKGKRRPAIWERQGPPKRTPAVWERRPAPAPTPARSEAAPDEEPKPGDWRRRVWSGLAIALGTEAAACWMTQPRWATVIPLTGLAVNGWLWHRQENTPGARAERVFERLRRHKVLKQVPRLQREEAVSVSTVELYWNCRDTVLTAARIGELSDHFAELLNVAVQAVYFDSESHCVVMRLSTGKIPSRIEYAEFLEEYPEPSGKLMVPVGPSREDGDWLELADGHTLVSGANGSGKTRVIAMWAAHLMRQRTAAELELAFIDMKAGAVEFGVFRGRPHLAKLPSTNEWAPRPLEQPAPVQPQAIASTTTAALALLQGLVAVMKARERLLSARDHSDIDSFNAHEATPMPRTLLFIDEAGRMAAQAAPPNSDERKLRAQIEAELATLVQGGRATGIRIVTSTQLANVETLPSPIRNEHTQRLAFRSEDVGSQVGLGRKSLAAARLAPHRGRAVLAVDGKEREVQVALLEREEVKALLPQSPAPEPAPRAPLEQARSLEVG